MKTHIAGLKVEGHPEFVKDDNLWLVRSVVDNGPRANPDNEFFVRIVPCDGHKTDAAHYQHGLLFFSNLPTKLLKKAMDIGIEVMLQNGFIEDDEDEEESHA
jgi:hypothetical protein